MRYPRSASKLSSVQALIPDPPEFRTCLDIPKGFQGELILTLPVRRLYVLNRKGLLKVHKK
jgi:hypothetical protein